MKHEYLRNNWPITPTSPKENVAWLLKQQATKPIKPQTEGTLHDLVGWVFCFQKKIKFDVNHPENQN